MRALVFFCVGLVASCSPDESTKSRVTSVGDWLVALHRVNDACGIAEALFLPAESAYQAVWSISRGVDYWLIDDAETERCAPRTMMRGDGTAFEQLVVHGGADLTHVVLFEPHARDARGSSSYTTEAGLFAGDVCTVVYALSATRLGDMP